MALESCYRKELVYGMDSVYILITSYCRIGVIYRKDVEKTRSQQTLGIS